MIAPEVLAEFAALGEDGTVYSTGSRHSYALLKIGSSCIYLVCAGEPESRDIVNLLREALVNGSLDHYRKCFIDISAYHGTVDWQEVSAIRELIGWPEDAVFNSAYVVGDGMMAALAKSLAAPFPNANFAICPDRAAALAWLAQVKAEPAASA